MYNLSYLLLIGVTLIIGLGASAYVKSKLKKYSHVPTATGLSGVEVAQRMLAAYGIPDVPIRQGKEGEDHYDPRSRSVSLSPSYYNGRSVTAIAVACHEVGHACQHAQSYTPMTVRSALFPVVSFTSNAWMFLLMAGIFLYSMNSFVPGDICIWIAIGMYSFAVLFQIVTLPVEFNASKRAMDYMGTIGVIEGEKQGAFSVLRACALTYVAAALTSILQLLWLLAQLRR